MTTGALSRAWRATRTFVRVGSLLAASACVTTYEDAPLLFGAADVSAPSYAVPVAIPIPQGNGTPEDIARAEFYRSVLKRLNDAAKDGDVALLESLLSAYERPDMPPAIAAHVAGYRAVVPGLRFQQHVAKVATLPLVDERGEVAAAPPPLGAPVALELRIPAGAEAWSLGGRDDVDPLRLVVGMRIDDTFVDGSSRSWESQDFVPLPGSFELRGDAVLRAPIAVEKPGGEAVRREVRVVVELMPGYLQLAGVRAPLRRALLATSTFTQWPVGYDAVAKAPLAALQAALRNFEPASFRRAYLAAVSTQGPDREMALGLLVQQVRFGRIDQAQVAMAALRGMTGADVAIGDRDGWLAWDQARR